MRRETRRLQNILRRAWRRFAPGAVKLWAGYFRGSRKLAALFRKWPVDLLAIQIVSSEEAVLAAKLARIPRILGTFHVDSARSRFRDRVLECVTNHSLHRAIAVSQSTKADWIRKTWLPTDRVEVIRNAIDPQRFQRRTDKAAARRALGIPSDGRLVVGAVGRLAEQKGFRYLLDAVARLSAEYPQLTVVLAGDGPLRKTLETHAARLGLANRVHFLGFRSDVQPVLDALDIFALPSLWEALPYALLEAMASELPAVGTTVAGVPEVILPGETGFLVKPHDPDAFASALRTLLQSPQLCRSMGEAARRRVIREFNMDDMLQKTFCLVRELMP